MTYNGWYTIKPNQTKSYIVNTYVFKDLALNDLQWLIYHKTKHRKPDHPLNNFFFFWYPNFFNFQLTII